MSHPLPTLFTALTLATIAVILAVSLVGMTGALDAPVPAAATPIGLESR